MNRNSSVIALLPSAFLALLSLVVVIIGSTYKVGTLTSMGSGFMPVLLGVLLFILAIILGLAAVREIPSTQALPMRPLILASVSMLVWALLAERFGFIPSAICQYLLACAALPRDRWLQLLAGSVIISALAYGLFVGLLGLPLRAMGW